MSRPVILIERPGLLATVQDLGRPGRASQGIAPSGALDRGALRIANRLLGNAEGAAALELTMGGFSAVLLGPEGSTGRPAAASAPAVHPAHAARSAHAASPAAGLWIVLAGAHGDATIDGRAIGQYEAVRWPVGARLEIGIAAAGIRFILAVRGGIDAPVIAGSRSTDVMAGLGRPPLAPGELVPIAGDAIAPIPANDLAPWGPAHEAIEVGVHPGPRADWFAPVALRTLFAARWLVTNDANRVGMRLDGPELPRVREGELPSEGMVVGAVQVPPSGRPTVLLADGPVTGGYPVIAVVAEASMDRLAQARPGERLIFRHASP